MHDKPVSSPEVCFSNQLFNLIITDSMYSANVDKPILDSTLDTANCDRAQHSLACHIDCIPQ